MNPNTARIVGNVRRRLCLTFFLARRIGELTCNPPMEGSQHAIDNFCLCLDIETNTTAKLFRLLGSSVSLCAHIGPKLFPVWLSLYFIFMRITWLSLIERGTGGSPILPKAPSTPSSSHLKIPSPFTAHRERAGEINKCKATIYWGQIHFIQRQFPPE